MCFTHLKEGNFDVIMIITGLQSSSFKWKMEVEYFDHLSGQMEPGFAEAPKEALPRDCRPDFGAALLTRHKFKVNESYNFWYSSGMPNIEILQDSNFGCHVKGPSAIEMIRRYLILSTRMSKFWHVKYTSQCCMGYDSRNNSWFLRAIDTPHLVKATSTIVKMVSQSKP